MISVELGEAGLAMLVAAVTLCNCGGKISKKLNSAGTWGVGALAGHGS